MVTRGRRFIKDEHRGMLRRRADGSLRPASEDADIADIWAEQKRIRLREAIEEDGRRKLKQKQRRERKLFGRRPQKNTGDQPGTPREIEIRLSLPKLRRPTWDEVEDFLAEVELPQVHRRHAIVAACVVTVGVLALLSPLAFGGGKHAGKQMAAQQGPKTAVSGAEVHRDAHPEFATLLPAGKTIQQLGGWGRVSPPGSDAVYAYTDTIEGISVTVSEQPLPDQFTTNVQQHMTGLAKQFGATKPIAMQGAGNYAYVGATPQGVQSLAANKQGLLILIRSVQPIQDTAWAAYLNALQ